MFVINAFVYTHAIGKKKSMVKEGLESMAGYGVPSAFHHSMYGMCEDHPKSMPSINTGTQVSAM